ncbi:MAG: hypothetical protein IJU70_08700 [Lentisphaeria bacterium]|nr:hypothetical protein [Lentisphaeria bacterium]
MTEKPVYILGAAAVTPFGSTVRENCDALLAVRTCFSAPRHFDGAGRLLGVDHDLDGGRNSRAERLLCKLESALPFSIPPGTRLFVATTIGVIDLLEQGGELDTAGEFLRLAERIFGISGGTLVSAACASGQTAAAAAMRALRRGTCRYALVIGGDITSEFVTRGFAALGALSRSVSRPYDADRDGLTLGEAAAALLLGTVGPGAGQLTNACENGDASHITSPDLSGRQLAAACRGALQGVPPDAVIGHGTGTVYNDRAEIAAMRELFSASPVPLFSLKGNLGHTLGATGVLQIALGLELAKRRILPPQAGLRTPEAGANAAKEARRLTGGRLLSLNVGFGGLNSAAVLEAL